MLRLAASRSGGLPQRAGRKARARSERSRQQRALGSALLGWGRENAVYTSYPFEQTKRAYERDGGKITSFHSTRYQAGTWSRLRRVVIKVEVSDQGVHTRFVVTDMEEARTKVLYQQIYCARGQAAQGPSRGGRPQRAETMKSRPIAPIRPIGTGSGRSDNLVLGA